MGKNKGQSPRKQVFFGGGSGDMVEDYLLAAGLWTANFEQLNSTEKSYLRYLAMMVSQAMGVPLAREGIRSVWLKTWGSDFLAITHPDTGRVVAIAPRTLVNKFETLRSMFQNEATSGNVTASDGTKESAAEVNNHDEGVLGFLGIDLWDDRGWLGNLL